jgi:hypothetical protein
MAGGVSVVPVTAASDDGSSRWKTFGERTIYDNPWVWLGQIDVELPDGERFWHHVVRLHKAAMMVLLDDQDRALLLWRHRFVQDRWGWELPGGLIDEGEEPAETARTRGRNWLPRRPGRAPGHVPAHGRHGRLGALCVRRPGARENWRAY